MLTKFILTCYVCVLDINLTVDCFWVTYHSNLAFSLFTSVALCTRNLVPGRLRGPACLCVCWVISRAKNSNHFLSSILARKWLVVSVWVMLWRKEYGKCGRNLILVLLRKSTMLWPGKDITRPGEESRNLFFFEEWTVLLYHYTLKKGSIN